MSNQKLVSTRLNRDDRAPIKVEKRHLLGPADILPSQDSLEIVGVLNAGFFTLNNRSFLVARVDEVVGCEEFRKIVKLHQCDAAVPYFDTRSNELYAVPVRYPSNYDPDHDHLIVPETFASSETLNDEGLYLPYLSHLRLVEITQDCSYVSDRILVQPSSKYDCFGCQDARTTVLDGNVILTYNGLGLFGSTIHCSRLDDQFIAAAPRVILAPDQKHACVFPERIGGQIYMVSRPLVRTYINAAGIWMYCSNDFVRWKVLTAVVLPRTNMWDCARVGPGAPPIATDRGWVLFYYGVDSENSYHVGAVILDLQDPSRIIARSDRPIFSPSLDWELRGQRADIVFPAGVNCNRDKDRIELYYGAADTHVAVASFSLSELMNFLLRDQSANS